jgi:cellulose synthase/poly-beta-1,6-N-acetylglucosamine synthase-like glycosyltransferase
MTAPGSRLTPQPLPALPAPVRVAVCIPAYGDPDGLARTLHSLDEVRHPRDLLQVVVVVDGPDAAVETVARAHADTTVVLPSNRGAYAARNAAIDAVDPAAGVIAFTDADVTVSPEWIDAHLRALQEAHVSGGAFRFLFSKRPTPAEHVDSVRHLNQRLSVEYLGYAITGNLAARADTVRALRFDDSLRSGGDRDFGIRARSAGYRLVYAEDAVVWHPTRRSAGALLHKVSRIASGIEQLRDTGSYRPGMRNYRRASAVARGRQEGRSRGLCWDLQVLALDQACNLVWAYRAPSALVPAVRRRLAALGRAARA